MFKLLIFIVFLFILLNQFKDINKNHEKFENILKENFQNNSVNTGDKKENNSDKSEVNSNKKENDSDEVLDIKNLVKDESYSVEKKDDNKKCKGKKEKECLFGCPKDKMDTLEESKDKRETNVEEMMMTIEDTEKLCNLIEKKDKERLEREEKENMKKQIELNKRFLIQQKAQNKQIEDLEKIVKEMTFTQKMNEVGIEKCGANADQCLTNKEKELIELMKKKKSDRKEVKINLNLENFSRLLNSNIKKKLKLNPVELNNIFNSVKNGDINPQQLSEQVFNSIEQDTNLNVNNNNVYNSDKNLGQIKRPEIKYVKNACKKCKIDLSKYIDRCKIPCYKCRDPAWNCPQDKK